MERRVRVAFAGDARARRAGRAWMTSGAIQCGVPMKVLRLDMVEVSCAATPKSASLTSPPAPSSMLPHLMSRCTCVVLLSSLLFVVVVVVVVVARTHVGVWEGVAVL